MKFQGRFRLFLMLVVAIGLSVLSYRGIGTEGKLSVSQIEQGLDLSGGVDIVYEADQELVSESEMANGSVCRFPVWKMQKKPLIKSVRRASFLLWTAEVRYC